MHFQDGVSACAQVGWDERRDGGAEGRLLHEAERGGNQGQHVKMPELEGAAHEAQQQKERSYRLPEIGDGHHHAAIQAVGQPAKMATQQDGGQDAGDRNDGKGKNFPCFREDPDANRQPRERTAEDGERLRGGDEIERAQIDSGGAAHRRFLALFPLYAR